MNSDNNLTTSTLIPDLHCMNVINRDTIAPRTATNGIASPAPHE